MPTSKRICGDFGESCACNYLRRNGYEIVERNYLKPCGEIDIIAQKDDYIAFVEVKTRKYGSLQSGAEAVNPEKQRRIIRTAELYLQEHETELQPRFDVCEVEVGNELRLLDINYYENAFDASGA